MNRQSPEYLAALDFLLGRINYEKSDPNRLAKRDFKLDRMQRLLTELGDPQLRIPAVHITGTKGKGTTCEFIARALSANGYRVGLFTSPHVEFFEERFRVDGQLASANQVVNYTEQLKLALAQLEAEDSQWDSLTFFELTTALAWLHFLASHVDIVVLEVGLGGRLDTTNLCRSIVTGITTISRDHTQVLGETLPEITFEKAGILKPGVPNYSTVLEPELQDVIDQQGRLKSAPSYQCHRDFEYEILEVDATQTILKVTHQGNTIESLIPVVPRHQRLNIVLTLCVVNELRTQGYTINPKTLPTALSEGLPPLRCETHPGFPNLVLDAAHNECSATALLTYLDDRFPKAPVTMLIGMARDKDIPVLCRLLSEKATRLIAITAPGNPRILSAELMQEAISQQTQKPVAVADNFDDAWKLAQELTVPEGVIVVAGSFYVSAHFRTWLKEHDFLPGHRFAPQELASEESLLDSPSP